MSLQATVVLDSGVFRANAHAGGNNHSDVCYFQSQPAHKDFRVYVDGDEMPPEVSLAKLGTGIINVRHYKTDGSIYTGVSFSSALLNQLHCYRHLYGKEVTINWLKFECTLRFHSGKARASMVKRRWFKEDGTHDPHSEYGPIAHNVVFHYDVGDGEVLEIVRASDGQLLCSTKNYSRNKLYEVEILADNTTAVKFYRDVLSLGPGQKALVPNQGDPPPVDYP